MDMNLLKIHGLCENGGVRQLYQSGRDPALFPVRGQPDDRRPGKGLEHGTSGTWKRRRAADFQRAAYAAVCQGTGGRL